MNPTLKSLILFALSLMSITSYSQDIITKKDGTDFQTKVLEVNTSDVKYKRFDNLNGPTFTILKSEIFLIKYENGTKDVFNQVTTPSNSTNSDICVQGLDDANKNYKGQNSGKGGTFFTTLLISPVVGLIPAVICSNSEPSDINLKYPNSELMKDMNYKHCYKEQAFKTKKRKIWESFGIGAGVWIVFILLASGS